MTCDQNFEHAIFFEMSPEKVLSKFCHANGEFHDPNFNRFYRFTRVTSGGSKGWPGMVSAVSFFLTIHSFSSSCFLFFNAAVNKCIQWPPVRTSPPCGPPNETGCKVAGLHNSCIHCVSSRSWCQITPLTQPCIISSGILGPPNTDVATSLATPNCCS